MPGSTESSISSLGDCEVPANIFRNIKTNYINITLDPHINRQKRNSQVDVVEDEDVSTLRRKVVELEAALAHNQRGGREVDEKDGDGVGVDMISDDCVEVDMTDDSQYGYPGV